MRCERATEVGSTQPRKDASSACRVSTSLCCIVPPPLLVHAQLLQHVHELRVPGGKPLHLAHARLRGVFARRRGDPSAQLPQHVRVQLVHVHTRVAGARPTGMCARKYSETRTCVSARKCSQVCSSFFLLARVLLFALSKKRAGCTAQMPPAQACVCVFCGAMMGTRRGLRIHVRKMHASAGDRNQKGAALAYAIFAPPSLQAQSGDSGSNISLLGTGPRGGCFAAVERQPRAVCAPPPLRAQSGDAEAARRALPLARPVYAISTQGGLYAPAAQVPATLCFGKAGISDKHPLSVPQAGATVHDLAKMHVHFLLNPV